MCIRLCAAMWTVDCQDPLSMVFPRQEYQSGLPFPSPGNLPNPGIKPVSPALAGGFPNTEPPGKPLTTLSLEFKDGDSETQMLEKFSSVITYQGLLGIEHDTEEDMVHDSRLGPQVSTGLMSHVYTCIDLRMKCLLCLHGYFIIKIIIFIFQFLL